jgi:large repetitive protein
MARAACHLILTCVWLVLAVACGGRVGADEGPVKRPPASGGTGGTKQPGSTGGTAAVADGGDTATLSTGTTEDPPIYGICGNGVLGSNERCDDANTNMGDGCSHFCVVEVDFTCEQVGKPCRRISVCGDAKLGTYEACDDGNLKDGDGCGSDCRREQGFICRTPGRACAPRCGDAVVVSGEECDNGPSNGKYVAGMTEGCSRGCKKVPSCMLAGAPNPCQGHCGDGIVDGNEACDSGADNDDGRYGGCTTACEFGPYCGDGIVSNEEDCDPGSGPTVDYGDPGCTAACRVPRHCGDGGVDSVYNEWCEPPSTMIAPGTYCTQMCQVGA